MSRVAIAGVSVGRDLLQCALGGAARVPPAEVALSASAKATYAVALTATKMGTALRRAEKASAASATRILVLNA